MTNDRSHLVPEQRTDRNGKTSTRWVKQTSAEALATLGIKPQPLPAPTYTQSLAAARITQINTFMGKRRDPDIMGRWVAGMDKRELNVLDGALKVCADTSTEPAVVREQAVIRSIFHYLARGSSTEDEIVLEMLAIRSAFCSDWSQQENPSVGNAELRSYMHGVRNNKNMFLENDKAIDGVTSVIRFAYEMNARFPDADFLPTSKGDAYRGFSSNKVESRVYVTADLAAFVYKNSSDTEQLIDIASRHRTNDVDLLRSLLENPEGATAVSRGWL